MSPHFFTRLSLTAAAVLLLAGCHPPPPQIWVPGEGYSETLLIELASSKVRLGEWLEIDAERHTGPWVRIPRPEKLPQGNCWWRRPPPPVERGVGANVRWFTEPEGKFNLPSPGDGFTRRVRFDRAGTYTIRAQSAGCPGPFDSSTLTIRVLP